MKVGALLLAVLLVLSLPAWAEVQIETAFSPQQGATDLVVKTIGKAHKTIRVAAYLITSRRIADALIKAQHGGIDVKIVVDKEQSATAHGSLTGYLKENGVPVRENGHYQHMHNKFMVIDDAIVESGSFNYTNTAENENAENVLVLQGAEKVVQDYQHQWSRLWDEAGTFSFFSGN